MTGRFTESRSKFQANHSGLVKNRLRSYHRQTGVSGNRQDIRYPITVRVIPESQIEEESWNDGTHRQPNYVAET